MPENRKRIADLRLRSVHEIDLPTVLQLGKLLGYAMPQQVEIVVVQGDDMLTLHEGLTPKVAAAVDKAVSVVRENLPSNSV